jgi:hypothetical protein
VVRPGGGEEAEHVIVLRTQHAPQRGMLRGRSARRRESAEAEPVPTTRATVVRAQPFGSREDAEKWLGGLRGEKGALESEAAQAAGPLNRLVRAHRVAAADPWAPDLSPEHALVVRVGYGDGDQVADGRYGAAYELPHERRGPRRRADLSPDERLAAILGGREQQLACEELVLRARADLHAGHPREAALQARIALEAVLAEVPDEAGLSEHRQAVADAANAALTATPSSDLQDGVAQAVTDMEAALRRRRLRSRQ